LYGRRRRDQRAEACHILVDPPRIQHRLERALSDRHASLRMSLVAHPIIRLAFAGHPAGKPACTSACMTPNTDACPTPLFLEHCAVTCAPHSFWRHLRMQDSGAEAVANALKQMQNAQVCGACCAQTALSAFAQHVAHGDLFRRGLMPTCRRGQV
jgi:hypothetical protein